MTSLDDKSVLHSFFDPRKLTSLITESTVCNGNIIAYTNGPPFKFDKIGWKGDPRRMLSIVAIRDHELVTMTELEIPDSFEVPIGIASIPNKILLAFKTHNAVKCAEIDVSKSKIDFSEPFELCKIDGGFFVFGIVDGEPTVFECEECTLRSRDGKFRKCDLPPARLWLSGFMYEGISSRMILYSDIGKIAIPSFTEPISIKNFAPPNELVLDMSELLVDLAIVGSEVAIETLKRAYRTGMD